MRDERDGRDAEDDVPQMGARDDEGACGSEPGRGDSGEPAASEGDLSRAPALSRRVLACLFAGAGACALVALGVRLVACARSVARVAPSLAGVADDASEACLAAASAGRDAAAVLDEPLGVVCIDPGHGATADLTLTPIGPGSEETQYVEPGGATGVVTGVPEYEVTLEVGLLLRDALEARGVRVVMTRETNDVVMSSEERAAVANAAGADLFVRLHCDGEDDPDLSGFSTLVPGVNEWTGAIYESSLYAAQVMHPLIVERLGVQDRGVVERADLAGFNFCEVPSVLFEMGFLSNPDEDVLLNDASYQQLLADAIADAACAYLEQVKG